MFLGLCLRLQKLSETEAKTSTRLSCKKIGFWYFKSIGEYTIGSRVKHIAAWCMP
jgi:hypothetical protein